MKKRQINWRKIGQVWIETVIYTLIAFVMMGLILSYAKPKIEEIQDNALLKQSTEMLKTIDSTILTMGAAGNQRTPGVTIKKGSLTIDGDGNPYCSSLACPTTPIDTTPPATCLAPVPNSCTDDDGHPYCSSLACPTTPIDTTPPATCPTGTFLCGDDADKIIFSMDSKNVYSEPGKIINDGSVKVETIKKSGFSTVTLTLDYADKYNIQVGGANIEKIIDKASTEYKLLIMNKDPSVTGGKIIMDITLN